MYVYVIISSSLKPYQNFRPDLSPACLLMFSLVIHDQRDRHFQNRPRVFYQVARVVPVAMTRENMAYAKTWSGVKLWSGVVEWSGFLECFFWSQI